MRKRVPSLTGGPNLAELRQKRGMSIQQISEKTKISVRYLRAIEAGDFAALPSGIYGRSYVRQYADAIDYNAESLLKLCPAESREENIAERRRDPLWCRLARRLHPAS